MQNAHDVAAEGPESRSPRPTGRRSWLRLVDAIVFGGALLLGVTAVSSTFSQPLSTGRALAYILLAPAAAIVLHRSLAFLQRRIASRSAQRAGPADWRIGLSKWLGAPIAAVLLCVGLEAVVLQRGWTVVREDLGPVVRALEAKVGANQPVPGDILDALGAAHRVDFVRYFPKDRAFVLAALGGSIDMDGETIYYDSQAGDWGRFHNDLAETDAPDAAQFKAATRDIQPIRYRRSDGSWERMVNQ